MKNNISLLIGLKNNIEYSKAFYETTRVLYPEIEIVFVSYGSIDNTHEWLNGLNDKNVIFEYHTESKTLADTYNRCIQLASNEYVAFLHNDIILAPNFIENLQKHIAKDTVVSYTTIEPPIFKGHNRPGKVIQDFGADITAFDTKKFYEYSTRISEINNNKTEEGIFFFMCLSRDLLIEIGGFDNLYNPMFREDDDLIYRLRLLNLKMFTSADALCYHFVSKTSRFSEEYELRTKTIEANSCRNFTRKWGFKHDSIHKKSYDICIVIKNCNDQILFELEPFAKMIYIDSEITKYTKIEQCNTKFILTDKVKSIQEYKEHQIVVKINGLHFNSKIKKFIERLADLIYKRSLLNNQWGYRYLPFNKIIIKRGVQIKINNFKSTEESLINRILP